ncbi:MAG: DUF6365 family protein [Candidatus Sericytochromatia bacterium]
MIKVLYVIAGDASFDEMLFLDAFLNQLPVQAIENHLLVPTLPLSHVTLRNRNLHITLAKPGFGREEWDQLLEEFKPQIVILVDPYVLLGEDAPNLTYVELDWLEGIESVLAVMDFRANLLKTPDDQLALEPYILANIEPPYTLDYDFLIKVCPPHDALPSKNPKLLQWNCQEPMSSLAVYGVRDEVRTQMGCPPDARLVTLVFPVENTMLGLEKGLAPHFSVVVETLISYLNQLEGRFLLSVINMPPPFEDFEFDNVMIRFFPVLDLELLTDLLKASELLLTESLTYPGLVFSALRGIPPIALGSSLELSVQGELVHRFGSLSPFLELKLENLKEQAPQTLFPFLSFPSRLRSKWPQTELYSLRYFFWLGDLFNEQRMVTLLHELLNQGPAYDAFQERLVEYREKKLPHTQDAEQLIRRLVTAPPRHLQQ